MQVFHRPTVPAGEIPAFNYETAWDVLYQVIIDAQAAGTAARRVRCSSDVTPLITGTPSGAWPGDPPRMIGQAGMDRQSFEVWEDLTLPVGTIIAE